MLRSEALEFLMEAHNGLSARIACEAGFDGIWASGLAISAQFGGPRQHEASWTQVVDMLEFMADASDLPILLDGDTGYGNFNNMRRLVRKLEQRGIAASALRTSSFPKPTVLERGTPAAGRYREFCGKIAAGKDNPDDPNFSVVARVEALIAGWSMEEALREPKRTGWPVRRHPDPQQTFEAGRNPDFAREWARRAPLVIVPTRYYSTPTDVFREAGISVVIWANQLVRRSRRRMQSVAKEICQSRHW